MRAAGAPRRMLVVDDDPMVRELVAAVVGDGDWDVAVAADGPEALRIALATPPDIVVLDVMMPGMSGFDVCRRLRAQPDCRDALVIMLTALDTAAARAEGEQSGADVYLTKPFSALQLLGAVSGAVVRAVR